MPLAGESAEKFPTITVERKNSFIQFYLSQIIQFPSGRENEMQEKHMKSINYYVFIYIKI